MIGGLGFAINGESARMKEKSEVLEKARWRRGRELYVANCNSCHGSRGEGIVGPALNSKVLLKESSEKQLFEIVPRGPARHDHARLGPGAWRALHRRGPPRRRRLPEVLVRSRPPSSSPTSTSRPPPRAPPSLPAPASSATARTATARPPPRSTTRSGSPSSTTSGTGRRSSAAAPAKGMPTWGTVLSPNQIEDLIQAHPGLARRGEGRHRNHRRRNWSAQPSSHSARATPRTRSSTSNGPSRSPSDRRSTSSPRSRRRSPPTSSTTPWNS